MPGRGCFPVHLSACDCLTPWGDARASHAALLRGESALRPTPVRGREGGDLVPLALLPGRDLDETAPPTWLGAVRMLLAKLPSADWGLARRPVFVTSSNFGVGNLHAFRRTAEPAHLAFGAPALCVEWLRRELGWGENITILSHACVSAHLGLLQATRAVAAGVAEEALVFSFDFLSPFVAGGFHALKILNGDFPSPYASRATGSIGLGDGAGFAVLTRARGDFVLGEQSLHNELHHFTANRADGAGFAACLAPVATTLAGRRTWLKGHGTGTLDAGRLEATAFAQFFPEAPLVGWKGALGHTLGSCGLVELALAVESIRVGQAPGTVGSHDPVLSDRVALAPLDVRGFDAVVCASNAFGGAHAALVLSPAEPAAPKSPITTEDWSATRFIQTVSTENPLLEEPATTRERLKARFAPGATRRMTQLGLLVGATLNEAAPAEEDAVIYASGFGESRALEAYLDSFPEASPTLFQTSIHPSGAQQALIGRQRSVREIYPHAGDRALMAAALLAAMLAPAERAIVCGGEERGTWLLDRGVASDRAFAFSVVLTRAAGEHPLGRVHLRHDAASVPVTSFRLADFFDALHQRRPFVGSVAPGLHLELSWS